MAIDWKRVFGQGYLCETNGCVTVDGKNIPATFKLGERHDNRKYVCERCMDLIKRTKTCQSCKHWDLGDGITDTDGVMIRACASPSWRGKFESRSTNSCKYWEEREEETKMKEEETCKRCNHWAGKGSKPPANEHTFRCYNTQYKWTYEGDTCSDWKEREGEKEMKEPTCPTCEEEEKGQQPFERALEIYTKELNEEAKRAVAKLKRESEQAARDLEIETEHLEIVDAILIEAKYLLEMNESYNRLSGKDLDRKGFRFGKNGFKYRRVPIDGWGNSCFYIKFKIQGEHKRLLEIGRKSDFMDKQTYFKNGKRTEYCDTDRLNQALRTIEQVIKQ